MAQQDSVRSRGSSARWIWIAAGLVAVAAAWYVHSSSRVVVVRVAEVERHDLVRTVSTNGKVVPTEDFQAHAPFDGEVKEVYVQLNQKVTAGQELIRMDDREARKNVASAQAALDSAKASLAAMEMGGTQDERLTSSNELQTAEEQEKQAANSLSSLQRLQAQGAASANEVVAAQNRLSVADARVAQLQTRRKSRYSSDELAAQKAQVAEAQAALSSAEGALAGVDVRAPFAGTVYALPVSKYDFMKGGDALLDVADLNHLEVLAYFDEPEVGSLAIGQPVKIVWDAKPNLVWHGHIFAAPTTIISYGTRNVGECLITVDDADGQLLPNTNVTVTVTTMQHPDVLSLPREALHTDGVSNFVYKIEKDHLVKTPVQVGVLNLTRFEITGGLVAGDKVALGAVTEEDLSNGLHVKEQN